MVAYVNNGGRIQSAGATSRAPTLPASRVNGNLLIAITSSKNNATHGVSGTGWVKYTQVNSGTGLTVSLCYCIVNGSEATPTISWTGSVACSSIISQWSGTALDTTPPFGNVNSNTGTTSTHSCTAVTTTRDASRVIYIDDANANTALATPTNFTEDWDLGSATDAGRSSGGGRNLASSGSSSGNISVTGANAAWVMWQIELLALQISPTGGSLTVTGAVPSMTFNVTIIPSAGALTITGAAPSLTVTNRITITPVAGTLIITGGAPTLTRTANVLITPNAGSLTLTGAQPSLSFQTVKIPSAGNLAVIGQIAVLTQTQHVYLTPLGASLILTGAAPVASQNMNYVPAPANLNLAGASPALSYSSTVVPEPANIEIDGYVPFVGTNTGFSPFASNVGIDGSLPIVAITHTPIVGSPAGRIGISDEPTTPGGVISNNPVRSGATVGIIGSKSSIGRAVAGTPGKVRASAS